MNNRFGDIHSRHLEYHDHKHYYRHLRVVVSKRIYKRINAIENELSRMEKLEKRNELTLTDQSMPF